MFSVSFHTPNMFPCVHWIIDLTHTHTALSPHCDNLLVVGAGGGILLWTVDHSVSTSRYCWAYGWMVYTCGWIVHM